MWGWRPPAAHPEASHLQGWSQVPTSLQHAMKLGISDIDVFFNRILGNLVGHPQTNPTWTSQQFSKSSYPGSSKHLGLANGWLNPPWCRHRNVNSTHQCFRTFNFLPFNPCNLQECVLKKKFSFKCSKQAILRVMYCIPSDSLEASLVALSSITAVKPPGHFAPEWSTVHRWWKSSSTGHLGMVWTSTTKLKGYSL